jgi:hypothetical protein
VAIFNLKYRDTLPILEVALLDPDGTAHDLTGSSAWKLHILLSDGTTHLTRDMTVFGDDSAGILRYQWQASDWDAASVGTGTQADPYTTGGLIAGPSLPLARGEVEHTMEYEVLGAGGARITFPNGGNNVADHYDTLRIVPDLGQAAA